MMIMLGAAAIFVNLSVCAKKVLLLFFFFQAEDGIRDYKVTGVQTCALPISVEGLADDPDRLAELDHPHPVARVAVPLGLDRHDEVEVPVGRGRLGASHVVVHARAADERPRDAHVLGELARDHADPLRADAEERVVLEHRFVLVDPLLDEVDSLADLLVPARRDVVARPADLVEAVEEPRARQLLEAVEHHLALADRVQEDGGAAAQRPAHVQAPGAEPEAVRRDPLQLGGDHAQVLRALGDVDPRDLLDGRDVRELRGHCGDVVGLRCDGRILDVGERLAELLVAPVEVADHRVHADDRLTLEREDHAKDAVGRRVLRPHVHHEALVTPVAQLDDLLGLGVGHYFIGEAGAGFRMIARISASSGVALEMNACQSGSFIALARTSARWFRSRYAQRWTTSLSCAISVCHSPTFFEYFSRTGMIALKCPSHSPVLPTWARYVRSSYTCAPSAGGFSGSCAERILFSCATSMGRILGTYSLLHASFFWSSARSRSRSSRLG